MTFRKRLLLDGLISKLQKNSLISIGEFGLAKYMVLFMYFSNSAKSSMPKKSLVGFLLDSLKSVIFFKTLW